MKNNVLIREEQALGSGQLLKVTASLYLKEALVAQEYESCQELIDTAKTLGVTQTDISAVITAYLRGDKAVAKNEANTSKNRLRSLTEE